MSDSELSDHAYFLAIEETFLALRGAPLVLSPSDWKVAQAWHRAGVPLDLVKRTLEEMFAAREERGDDRRVSSLRYCRRAVEKAWKQEQELLSTGDRVSAEPVELRGRLEALAAALPPSFAGRARLEEELKAISTEGGAEAVEEQLAALDVRLFERILDPETRSVEASVLAEVEAEIDRSLVALRDRLPAEELEKARERLRRQQLRRHLEFPVLSLFAPEANP